MNRNTDYQEKQSTGPQLIPLLAGALIVFGLVALPVIVLGIVARSEPPTAQRARHNVTLDARLDGAVDRGPVAIEADNADVKPHCLNACWKPSGVVIQDATGAATQ